MRLPSIEQLVRVGRESAGRFPLVLLSAAVAAGAGALLPDSSIEDTLVGFLYVATLGIPLFLAVDLTAERRGTSGRTLWIGRLAVLAILVGLYVARLPWSEPVEWLRYVQLSVAAHLLVAVAPYLGVREWNGFWQYNRSLLLRFLIAGVFSFVLYVGLSIALLAIDNLLGVNVEGETYFRLWCVIAFLFNTWFFTAGIPEDLEALDRRTDYPPALKVLGQYILSPLVTVYLLIITAYLGRILITRVWPSGWIGYLVSSVAVAGILSLLLLYPIEEREENGWVRTYARWFYFGLIPANIMLLLAIWKRIQQYSITEPRYFLVILSLWLAGISLFYAFTRSRNIKVIPSTLALLAIVTFAGPWSAYAVSQRSQTARLEGLLEQNGMLVDGRVRLPAGEVSFEDRREIGAVLRYLAEYHGTGSIVAWFPEGRLAAVDTIANGTGPSEPRDADDRAALIAAELGVDYVASWTPGEGEGFNFFVEQNGPPLRISGYDYVLRDRSSVGDTVRVEESSVGFAYDEERLAIVMLGDDAELLSLPLTPLIERAIDRFRGQASTTALPADLLALRGESDGARLAVFVTAIAGTIDSGETDTYRVRTISADYYYSWDQGVAADADSASSIP
ncbi:MAG: DUF4153 domain-containing protein [marine benthic group bacterium]|nr:DUF4153 domain-containing protein [Gemmatimonadota bacterium]